MKRNVINQISPNSTERFKIKQVRKEDEGLFECQVSTAQIVGHSIYLKVTGEGLAKAEKNPWF